jgi:hypothetical protein
MEPNVADQIYQHGLKHTDDGRYAQVQQTPGKEYT